MTIGDFIKIKRGARAMTLEDLSRAASISMHTLWKIESGKTKNPSLSTISSIAKALGVSVDSLQPKGRGK